MLIVPNNFLNSVLVSTFTHMHFDGLKAPINPTSPEEANMIPVQIPHPIIYRPNLYPNTYWAT